ncbi:MAG: ATP-binding protein [Bryobacteraceae bacterium]|nr:ATP-binding protein [Bryobacteraceae bacterium]
MSDPAGASAERELDLTRRKLAEAHKMASLGRLAAGIVHEINTPIGSILSNNETIRRSLNSLRKLLGTAVEQGLPPTPRTLAVLDTLASLTDIDKIACERILGIIRGLKTFARVNESDLQRVNIHEILLNTIKLTNCVFRRRITVVTEFDENLPDVECYPGLLNQVFLNLVVNASQAIEAEGTITIRTRSDGERAHVSVSDTGSGIPEAVRPRIFAAGFTTKPIGEGTGLGLTITREIVEDTHGGKITFETETGVGTTFHLWIPLRQPRSQERP